MDVHGPTLFGAGPFSRSSHELPSQWLLLFAGGMLLLPSLRKRVKSPVAYVLSPSAVRL